MRFFGGDFRLGGVFRVFRTRFFELGANGELVFFYLGKPSRDFGAELLLEHFFIHGVLDF